MLDGFDVIHVFDDALVNDGLRGSVERCERGEMAVIIIAVFVERRHVDAIDIEQATEIPAAPVRAAVCFPRLVDVADFRDDLFALADDEEIEERRDRLDVVNARPAADDERVVHRAVSRMERDASEVEHVEHVRINHLVLQREAKEREVLDFRLRFERIERDALRPHDIFHVRPRRIDAFGRDVGAAVQDFVEDGEAEVAHADLVDVRQRERERAFDICMILDDDIPFTARIACGLFDTLQHAGVEGYHFVQFSPYRKRAAKPPPLRLE